MKRFIFKLFPYISIFLILAGVRYWINFDHRYRFYINPEKIITNKTVIIGDSKTLLGIDESVFRQNQIELINLSSWRAFPVDHLNALSNHTLENNLLLINVSSRIFLQPDSSNHGESPNEINQIFNFRLHKKALLQLNHSYPGNWEYEIQKGGSLTFKNNFRTYKKYDWKLDSTEYSALLQDTMTNILTRVKVDHFTKLVKRLSRNNRIVLIDLPERNNFEKLIQDYENQLFNTIQNQTGKKVHDFGIFNDSLFYDSHHLNRDGSTIFSHQLFEMIQKWN